MRIALGIFVLVFSGWFLSALVGTPEEVASAAGPTEWVSSQQCRECHQQVWDEWANSPHANSWNNEDVRVQSDQFANKDCIDCHAPRPIFETGVGERVLPRSARRAEGVDCLTCHLLPDGRMAGKVDNPRAACQPTTRRELQRVTMCSGCHDQHKTERQWKETPLAEHDSVMARTAVTVTGERADDGACEVTIANIAGGRSYPTDERSRASDIWWRPMPADADALAESGVAADGGAWRHLHRIRDPYRHEKDLVSTLLHYGQSRTLRIEDADAEGGVEVALVYKRSPYYRDPATGLAKHLEEVTDPFEDAELVHRLTLEP